MASPRQVVWRNKKRFQTRVEAVMQAKFDYYAEEFRGMVIDNALASIKEHGTDGLVQHIDIVEGTRDGFSRSKTLLIDKPYAKFVEDGRGPVRPFATSEWAEEHPDKEPILSNINTSAPKGHSKFVATSAGPFEGHHFVQRAITDLKARKDIQQSIPNYKVLPAMLERLRARNEAKKWRKAAAKGKESFAKWKEGKKKTKGFGKKSFGNK